MRSMDVGRYIHNYEGFMKNLLTKYLLIWGEQSQLKVPMKALWAFSHFFFLYW